MIVRLTDDEKDFCQYVVDKWLTRAEFKPARNGDQKHNALLGSLSEYAVAKGLRIFWSGAGLTKAQENDVCAFQVRAVDKPNRRLLVRPWEIDEDMEARRRPWIFVERLDEHTFKIHGWIFGWEAPMRGTFENPGNKGTAIFVLPSRLRPIEDLVARVAPDEFGEIELLVPA